MTIETGLREMIRELVREELRAALAAPTVANQNEREPFVATPAAPTAEYVSDVELAAWIGVSRETLQALRRGTDGPPYVRVARRAVRYHLPAVREWLAKRTAR